MACWTRSIKYIFRNADYELPILFRKPRRPDPQRLSTIRNPKSLIRNREMPANQPFTRLCQQLARPATTGRADLHLHTTHSDGDYTPAEIVDLARRSGLSAIAITDHDTTCGVAAARTAAKERVEV